MIFLYPMKTINFRYIYERTRQLLLDPKQEWTVIGDEYNNPKDMFRDYLIPLSVIVSVIVLLFGFLHYTILEAFFSGLINLVSTTAGTWVCFLICREYMNKTDQTETTALQLTVYSSALFILFHSLATAFGNGFFGQLMSLSSLLFIRTLYIGIHKTSDLQSAQKKNLLIIMILSIICIPVIMKKILMIIFNIPAFNL